MIRLWGSRKIFFDSDSNMKLSMFCYPNYSMVLDNLQGLGQALIFVCDCFQTSVIP